MMHDHGAIAAALAAAVGDDPGLAAELRDAFVASAVIHATALRIAADRTEWDDAAARLRGLSASFGATELMRLAERAVALAPGDAAILRRIDRAIALAES